MMVKAVHVMQGDVHHGRKVVGFATLPEKRGQIGILLEELFEGWGAGVMWYEPNDEIEVERGNSN